MVTSSGMVGISDTSLKIQEGRNNKQFLGFLHTLISFLKNYISPTHSQKWTTKVMGMVYNPASHTPIITSLLPLTIAQRILNLRVPQNHQEDL